MVPGLQAFFSLILGLVSRAVSSLQVPTHTDADLGVDKWAVGPAPIVGKPTGVAFLR